MNITFIGLGIMGQHMAHNLLSSGHSLTVYNRSKAPVEALAQQGARAAGSFAEAVAAADVVFTMLANPEAVAAVMLDDALAHLRAGALWVDCSTVDPAFARRCAAAAQDQGLRYLDAPVAGTKPTAAEGKLTFFVGGAAEDLAQVRPLLAYMGPKVLHIGSQGQGAAFKMLVNSLLAQAMLAFSEAVHLGTALGLDRAFLLDTLPQLLVAAPFLQAKAERMGQDEYEAQFPLELMHKDLHLVSCCGYESGQPLPLANLAKEFYAQAEAAGLGREDFAAIFKAGAKP